jgi:hypothetical protein
VIQEKSCTTELYLERQMQFLFLFEALPEHRFSDMLRKISGSCISDGADA